MLVTPSEANNSATCFCESCGSRMMTTNTKCTQCGEPNRLYGKSLNTRSSYVPKSNTYGSSNNNSLVMSEGEKKIKSYHCSQLTFPKCDGYVTVTNKRIIFHGDSFKGRVIDEVKIDTVSAISSMYGIKIKWKLLIAGILILLVGIISIIIASNMGSIFLSMLPIFAIGALLIFLSRKEVFTLKIFSSSASGAPIAVGEGESNNPFFKNTAGYSVIAKPGHNTDKMMLELGALVSDLQTMGDLAIDKWKGK